MASDDLASRFKAAVAFAQDPKSPGGPPGRSTMLDLYGLFKASTEGPAKASAKPSRLRPVAYAKWAAWSKLGKIDRAKAMERYIETLAKTSPEFRKRSQVSLRSKL